MQVPAAVTLPVVSGPSDPSAPMHQTWCDSPRILTLGASGGGLAETERCMLIERALDELFFDRAWKSATGGPGSNRTKVNCDHQ